MPGEGAQLLCYNRGCGQTFDPQHNNRDSCTYHPGAPFFHDAYKGWSCCKKKCTDFTEFLNIKGCTTSYHSNEKPPEPEKPIVDRSKVEEVIEYKAPEPSAPALDRPPFNSPLVKLCPEVAPVVAQQAETLKRSGEATCQETEHTTEVPAGTPCKNNGCKQVYDNLQSADNNCTHHPGAPIFHEGLKYWTCCQRRTTDFDSFLEQPGCVVGRHVWFKEKKAGDEQVVCRYDWHQTPGNVVVSIFAKKYDPHCSSVELNPVRLKAHVFFPQENGSFNLDLELRGVVDVSKSTVCMLQTKIEIKLRKAEPGSWSKLDVPRAAGDDSKLSDQNPSVEESLVPPVDAVDLSDL